MSYKKQIDADMAAAAKAQDKIRLSALRMMKSSLHNREIDLHRELTEAEFHQALSAMVKQRKDSIEQFSRGGRTDLVEKETAEMQVISAFLPQQMSEADVAAVIEQAIAQENAMGLKDMGKVMKALMPVISGKADGKVVSDLVKARLSR